ncbi:pilus assembly protein TadG-related protein [Cellulomonas sp.]|uniref:pilus assembly protein TadG-related protein n=1 Tax=Cellulomonas sp. TaxID=40001 RepID=UPI002810F154|nr:pilus assembly protein TadG-related protein [Cellulomonas sp.]
MSGRTWPGRHGASGRNAARRDGRGQQRARTGALDTLRGHASGDDGQVTVLALGLAVLVLLLVTVTVSATGVHLDRKRLLATADLAALAAADAVADDRYFGGAASRGPAGVPLTDAGVRAAVEDYVRAHPEAGARWGGVSVLEASTPDGRSVVVRLRAVTRPVLLSWVMAPWSDGITLEAQSVARAS